MPGYEGVHSRKFFKGLEAANQAEYAAAAGMADNALTQKSAIVRQESVLAALMDRLKFTEEARKKADKTNKLFALASGLGSGGKQQSVRSGQPRHAGDSLLGSLDTLVKFHGMEDALDTSMYKQLGVLNAMDETGKELFGTVPAPSTSQTSLPDISRASIKVEPAPTVGNTFSEKARFEAEVFKKFIESNRLGSAKA